MAQPIKIDSELMYGFSGAVLSARYDQPKKTPPFHIKLWDLCCDPYPWVAIAAPRHHAKTTCVTHAFVLANVLFRVRNNVLIVSDTEAQAKTFLGDIKMELTENAILMQDFQIAEIVKDNETEIIVRFKDGEMFRICARGAGQKLRGLKWRGRRPDLVICDDMENDELILNEDRRDKLKNWFLGALIPIGSDDCIFRVVGTILSMDSLLENLLNDSSWKSARFAAHNDDFSEILWPEMWPKEKLLAQRKMYVNQGKPDVYSREFLNVPISEEGAFFRPSDFRDLVPIPKDQQTPLNYYITCDLAISTSIRANYSVFTVSAIDQNNHIRVMQVVRERFDSLQIIDTLFSLYTHYKPVMIAIEGGQIARAIVPMINAEMLVRNIFMKIEVLTPIGDKKLRAGPIQARMRQGTVQFNKNTDWFPAFQQELLQFDKGAYDDQVDSFAWLGQLLDKLHAAPTRTEWEEELYNEMYEDSTDFSEMQGFDMVGGY